MVLFNLQYILTFPLTLIELFCIFIYRRLISHAIQKSCNFTPSCSKYAFDSILEFGAIYGAILAFKRLKRCNIKGSSGYDYPKLNIYRNYKWKC